MEHTWFPMGEVTLTVRKKLKFVLDILPSPQASQELQASGWVDGEKINGEREKKWNTSCSTLATPPLLPLSQ